METNDVGVSEKKQVERSAAYPNLTLAQAIDFTTSLSKHFTNSQIVSRHDIAAVLQTSHGNIIRDVAASAHYGLLTKHKEGYQISSLFKKLLNPLNEVDKLTHQIQAFKLPKLFQELIGKFDGHAVPKELRTHLIRFHSITDKSANKVAEIFIESAKFCKVLNDNNILTVSSTLSGLKDNVEFVEVITDDDPQKPIDITHTSNVTNNREPKLLGTGIQGEEQIKIRLTDRKYAYLVYPININSKDINILRKQIDVLEEYTDDK